MSTSVAQSRQQLSALIAAAQEQPQVITKHNTPVAVLVIVIDAPGSADFVSSVTTPLTETCCAVAEALSPKTHSTTATPTRNTRIADSQFLPSSSRRFRQRTCRNRDEGARPRPAEARTHAGFWVRCPPESRSNCDRSRTWAARAGALPLHGRVGDRGLP